MKNTMSVILCCAALITLTQPAIAEPRQCYAVAMPTQGHGGHAWSLDKKLAENFAIDYCREYASQTGGTPNTCRITTSTCGSDQPAVEQNPKSVISGERIQGCEIKSLPNMKYQSGSKHDFCLGHGWNGGAIPNNSDGFCWKTPINGSVNDCPRLNLFYQCKSGNCCDHLTDDDAKKLKVCKYN